MPTDLVDLRSDTVTRPTGAMREAMSTAVVGDDGYGEDPTVAALEATFAERVGKDAAVFVPSGVMGNQIALRILTRPGDTVLSGRRQHVVLYELGAAARNACVELLGLDDTDGRLRLEDVAAALEGEHHHQVAISAIAVESPHMASGGGIWEPEQLAELARVADGRPVHLDGARLFNASVALGLEPSALCAAADTVMCCLSKGLCAPVGSLLAGSAERMELARIERKRLGGSLRQAGVLAAPGLLALDEMVDRLSEDHQRARRLAAAVAERWPELAPGLESQRINLVVFEHAEPASLLAHLEAHGILAGTLAPGVVRLVTHHDVDDEGIERAVEAIGSAP